MCLNVLFSIYLIRIMNEFHFFVKYNKYMFSSLRFFCRFCSEEAKELEFTLTLPAVASSVISDLTCCESNILLYSACVSLHNLVVLPKMFELQHLNANSPQVILKKTIKHTPKGLVHVVSILGCVVHCLCVLILGIITE